MDNNKLLIFTGEEPKNPCEKCRLKGGAFCLYDCSRSGKYDAQLSILNQCVEVSSKVLLKWLQGAEKLDGSLAILQYPTLTQFLQSEIKKQESKDE